MAESRGKSVSDLRLHGVARSHSMSLELEAPASTVVSSVILEGEEMQNSSYIDGSWLFHL